MASTLVEALVTPLRTTGRKQLPKPTTNLEFRDDEKRLRVANRENFVGRRRQLQNCLRTLKTDDNKVGILIYGMGGWGKSSIASRLWDRLPEHEKILWWRQINEFDLIKKLKDKLIKPSQLELITYLENSQILLKSRLVYLFRQLADMRENPFLLIFDDFEWNLEPREGRYILKPQAAPILEALVQAIQETGTDNRIIITCRYDFGSDLLEFFYKQGLEPLKNAELTKKLSRLENFSSDKVSDALRERALALADGNPRLLEFLNNEILDKQDAEDKLTELERSPALWKDKIIWEELYQLIDKPLQEILKQWKEADEETAWIFYQIMVKENYKDWRDLLNNFPCETLKEINRLWLENSNNKFGISIQSEIYHLLGGTQTYQDNIWEQFCDRVGWRKGDSYQRYNEIVPITDIGTHDYHMGRLPVLLYTRVQPSGCNVIAHDAQGIELKAVLMLCLFDGIKEHFPTFQACQAKFPIIATGGDVVAVVGLEVTGFSSHLFSNRGSVITYQ